MAAPDRTLCHLGLTADPCAYDHVAAKVPRGREGDRSNRLCPCHDDRKASLSINPGDRGQRVVWKCQAGCSPEDIRTALLGHGIHESCLGRYGLPKRAAAPGMRIIGQDAALVADAKRYHAIVKLPGDLNGSLLRMCIVAISEGDGDLPADPLVLLGVNADDFYGLADRSGIDAKYKYKLFKAWLAGAP